MQWESSMRVFVPEGWRSLPHRELWWGLVCLATSQSSLWDFDQQPSGINNIMLIAHCFWCAKIKTGAQTYTLENEAGWYKRRAENRLMHKRFCFRNPYRSLCSGFSEIRWGNIPPVWLFPLELYQRVLWKVFRRLFRRLLCRTHRLGTCLASKLQPPPQRTCPPPQSLPLMPFHTKSPKLIKASEYLDVCFVSFFAKQTLTTFALWQLKCFAGKSRESTPYFVF